METRQRGWGWSVAVVAGVLLVPALGCGAPATAPSASSASGDAATLPPVAVTRVTRADLTENLVVEAEFRPYQEVAVHAKVAGFLEKMLVDIGDRVEEHALVATLEIPESQDDLDHAQAVKSRCQQQIKRAQAECEEASLEYTRLQAVAQSQPGLLAQQELDGARIKQAKAEASLAAAEQELRVAETDVHRLETMLAYTQISVPFAGVITKRYADHGALIQAGTSSNALPVVRLSELQRLRMVFPVTVSYAARVKVGDPVDVQIPALGKQLTVKVSRITHKVETATRTMEAEADVENPDLAILPGMYATATITLEERKQVLALAVQAVTDRAASTVYRVGSDQKLEECRVRLGLETPYQVEVLEGLNENDLVVFGSRAQLRVGQQVEPKVVELETTH